MRNERASPVVLALCVLAAFVAPTNAEEPRARAQAEVTVTYAASLCPSFTGRVYVMFGRSRQEPRFGPNWFKPAPFFALDVEGWKPGVPLRFDDTALAFPAPLSRLAPGRYRVQALMRLNPDAPALGRGAGNAFSRVLAVEATPEGAVRAQLEITETVPPRRFDETERVKLHEMRSALLSAFHGRDVFLRAAVVLPTGFAETASRRYPALYLLHGFGGSHHGYRRLARDPQAGHESDIVRIVLDPSCGGGHHVFADSANNGPRGRALTEELIPALEKRFRLVPEASGRYLSGISSGGWASLWLQIAYPDVFGGVWAFAPDPVDFRDFQQIDLYAEGANMYRDETGERRPLARAGDRVLVWYEDFAKMERVVGDGGQLGSFEWVFSPRGKDGKPLPLFDRETGAVDPEVAEAWRAYDIRLKLEREWKALAPKLSGKIRVFMGGKDTFYLDGATRRLKRALEALGSDAVVEIDEEANHGSIYSRELLQRVDREIMEQFRKAHPN